MLKKTLKKMQEAMKEKFTKKSRVDTIIEKITEVPIVEVKAKKVVSPHSFDSKKDVGNQIWEWLNIK